MRHAAPCCADDRGRAARSAAEVPDRVQRAAHGAGRADDRHAGLRPQRQVPQRTGGNAGTALRCAHFAERSVCVLGAGEKGSLRAVYSSIRARRTARERGCGASPVHVPLVVVQSCMRNWLSAHGEPPPPDPLLVRESARSPQRCRRQRLSSHRWACPVPAATSPARATRYFCERSPGWCRANVSGWCRCSGPR
jgi:hypothetical protein